MLTLFNKAPYFTKFGMEQGEEENNSLLLEIGKKGILNYAKNVSSVNLSAPLKCLLGSQCLIKIKPVPAKQNSTAKQNLWSMY